MKLFYWEEGCEAATDEELPESCNSLRKAQARAAAVFTAALHEKHLTAPGGAWADAWAGIADDTGRIVSWLYRRGGSWIWKDVQ